jgi:hypothetical protein
MPIFINISGIILATARKYLNKRGAPQSPAARVQTYPPYTDIKKPRQIARVLNRGENRRIVELFGGGIDGV